MAEFRSASPHRAQEKRTGGRRKSIIGGAIIALVIVWLIYSNIGGSSTYYMTVEELLAEGPSDRLLGCTGFVLGQSIEWDPQQTVLRFEIADESGSLPVLYKGLRRGLLEDGLRLWSRAEARGLVSLRPLLCSSNVLRSMWRSEKWPPLALGPMSLPWPSCCTGRWPPLWGCGRDHADSPRALRKRCGQWRFSWS